MTEVAEQQSHQLRLSDRLDITNASGLRDEWADFVERHFGKSVALKDAGILELDGSAVERVDTAGVQLLAALARAVESHGASIAWGTRSELVDAAAASLGMTAAIASGSNDGQEQNEGND